MASGEFKCGDCLELLKAMETDSVDLVFCSPPYEAARTYGIGFNLRGQAWVDWCVERYLECVRISRGAVFWNVEGQTRKFQWSATPALLMADLHRAGVKLRKAPIFQRVGIPGSGGPDWFRNDYEFIVASSKGKLPWSENTAMGRPPKFAPGGAMSHRVTNGTRKDQWGGSAPTRERKKNGSRVITAARPSHRFPDRKNQDGIRGEKRIGAPRYDGVTIANPGNIVKCHVGGGAMGSKLAHKNEAPFPEALAEFFIRSCCPPNGLVLDPFSGSGTTVCVAVRCGRNGIGIDVRQSQVELGYQRLAEVQTQLF